MKERALNYLLEDKTMYEKKIKSSESKMRKYEPTKLGYKDAKMMKEYCEERLEIVNYIIEQMKGE